MSTVTEAQTKQIVGSCHEVTEKNGWTTFMVDTGSQYPTRLSTKLPALIEQARAVYDARSVWTFKESQGGENPNKPGTHYTNRYLEKVELGGGDATVQVGTNATGAIPHKPSEWTQKPDVDWDAKERRDYRSRAWAQALSALPWQHMLEADKPVDDYFELVQKLQRKIFQDVCGSFAYPDDSDIPFA